MASLPKPEGSLGSLVPLRTLQESWGSFLLSHCTQPSSPMKPRWLTHATHGLVQRFYMIREPKYVSMHVTESPLVTCISLEGGPLVSLFNFRRRPVSFYKRT